MFGVSAEVDLLLRTARQQMNPADPRVLNLCRSATIDWDCLFRMADAQRIAPLVCHNLLRLPDTRNVIPAEVLGRFEWSRKWTAAIKTSRFAKIAEVAHVLNGCSVRVMILKGAALDQVVFAEPWFMISDDADLLIERGFDDTPPDARESLDRILRAAPMLEVEYFRHHDLDIAGILDIDYDRLWRDARPLTIQGEQVWVMSTEDMLLAASVNLCRKRFSRLKEMCAVAEIVDPSRALNWQKVAQNARGAGLERIVCTALAVVQSILGCAVPEEAFTALAIGRIRRAAIRHASAASRPFLRPIRVAPYESRWARIAGWGLRFLSYHPRQLGRQARLLYRRSIAKPK